MEFAVTEDHEHPIGFGNRRQFVPWLDQFVYHFSAFLQEDHDESAVDDSIDDAAIEFESACSLNPPAPGRFRGKSG